MRTNWRKQQFVRIVIWTGLKASRKRCSQLGLGHFANLLPNSGAIRHNPVHLSCNGILNPSQGSKGESRYGQDFFATFDDGKRVQIRAFILTESVYLRGRIPAGKLGDRNRPKSSAINRVRQQSRHHR